MMMMMRHCYVTGKNPVPAAADSHQHETCHQLKAACCFEAKHITAYAPTPASSAAQQRWHTMVQHCLRYDVAFIWSKKNR
jgi:hypothetical protein